MGRIREFFLGVPLELDVDEDVSARRDTSVVPIEGTDMSLFWSQIPAFWQETYGTPWYGTPSLGERVWVANRCIQLNAQQIASMPLRFHGSDSATDPAWVSNPDPNWYPNGISDAVFSIVRLLYGWGFACLYATAFYADGFPQFWTVLDSSRLSIDELDGRRRYRFDDTELNPARIVQIDRNPSTAVHGTPALRAYAMQAASLLAAAGQSFTASSGGVPKVVLKVKDKKIDDAQAEVIQSRYAARIEARGNVPPVFGPDVDLETIGFNPEDLALISTQEFDAKAIATAFGVPAVLLNMALQGGLTYQNPAALGEMWWRFELRPTAKRIADALSANMLPRGAWVDFHAEDTFAPLDTATVSETEDDVQLAEPSPTAPATPAQQPGRLTAVTGG